MFELKNINYKNILNIDQLKFYKNKVNVILGESGSGKSTLLKLLNKLISPDSGQILYKGKDLSKIDSIKLRKEVTMLSQNHLNLPGSIKDNLNIALQFSYKTPLSDQDMIQILKRVNLHKDINMDSSKLSGGEKQRLALARIMALDSQVVLLDEPTSALDLENEEEIISDIVNYSKENNKTLIMVTHSKNISENFGDHIVVLKNGRLKEIIK